MKWFLIVLTAMPPGAELREQEIPTLGEWDCRERLEALYEQWEDAPKGFIGIAKCEERPVDEE